MQKIPADLCLDQSWNEMAVLFVCDVRENEHRVREFLYTFIKSRTLYHLIIIISAVLSAITDNLHTHTLPYLHTILYHIPIKDTCTA